MHILPVLSGFKQIALTYAAKQLFILTGINRTINSFCEDLLLVLGFSLFFSIYSICWVLCTSFLVYCFILMEHISGAFLGKYMVNLWYFKKPVYMEWVLVQPLSCRVELYLEFRGESDLLVVWELCFIHLQPAAMVLKSLLLLFSVGDIFISGSFQEPFIP